MKSNSKQRGPKTKETTKKFKKKPSILSQAQVSYVDYKDVDLLQRFVSDRSKIRARRVSSNDVQQQRDVATAIKNAREMALMPYAKRVTNQRGGRGGGGGGGRYNAPEAAAASAADLEAIDAIDTTDGLEEIDGAEGTE
jgi:small subunit ribosomal protein S18